MVPPDQAKHSGPGKSVFRLRMKRSTERWPTQIRNHLNSKSQHRRVVDQDLGKHQRSSAGLDLCDSIHDWQKYEVEGSDWHGVTGIQVQSSTTPDKAFQIHHTGWLL